MEAVASSAESAVRSDTSEATHDPAASAPNAGAQRVQSGTAVSDRPGFRPDLQGIRAIAILAVVAYHVGLPGFSGGFVGVDVFFVLSGYLITGLLVREAGSAGGLSFRRFYARRLRRLLPVSAVVLLVTLVISALLYSPIEMRSISSTAAAVALYVSNFVFASRSVSYLGAGTLGADPYLHTWSLAVEEQFYLVWPLFIAVLMWAGTRLRTPRRVLMGGIVAMAVGSFAVCVLLAGSRHPWAFFGSPPRFWEFAIGGLAGLVPVSWFGRARVASVLTVLGAVLVGVTIVVYGASTPFPGTTTLVPVAGTVMLLLAGAAGVQTRVGRPLRTRAALWFGEHSYSWYLWHWPALIFVAVLWPSAGLVVKTLAVIVALGASMLTYRFVEQRVRYNGYLAARPRRSIAFGLAATVLCALIAGAVFVRADAATKTPAQARFITSTTDIRYGDCSTVTGAGSTTCGFGDVTSDKTIVLFGDSHAAMWNDTFDRLGREHGYRVIPVELAGCPPADVKNFFSPPLGRMYPECAPWREKAFKAIGDLHPDLVVFSTDANVFVGTPDHESETGLTSEDWTKGIGRTASRFAEMGVPFAMVADVPAPGFNVPDCLSRQEGALIGGGSCDFDRDVVYPPSRSAVRAVKGSKNGAVIDLTDEICPAKSCRVMRDGMVLYIDGDHLTPDFAASLSGAMWDQVDHVLASNGHT
jgi:peptidoglycan/LPS O-acetylase OafA/YrhL